MTGGSDGWGWGGGWAVSMGWRRGGFGGIGTIVVVLVIAFFELRRRNS